MARNGPQVMRRGIFIVKEYLIHTVISSISLRDKRKIVLLKWDRLFC